MAKGKAKQTQLQQEVAKKRAEISRKDRELRKLRRQLQKPRAGGGGAAAPTSALRSTKMSSWIKAEPELLSFFCVDGRPPAFKTPMRETLPSLPISEKGEYPLLFGEGQTVFLLTCSGMNFNQGTAATAEDVEKGAKGHSRERWCRKALPFAIEGDFRHSRQPSGWAAEPLVTAAGHEWTHCVDYTIRDGAVACRLDWDSPPDVLDALVETAADEVGLLRLATKTASSLGYRPGIRPGDPTGAPCFEGILRDLSPAEFYNRTQFQREYAETRPRRHSSLIGDVFGDAIDGLLAGQRAHSGVNKLSSLFPRTWEREKDIDPKNTVVETGPKNPLMPSVGGIADAKHRADTYAHHPRGFITVSHHLQEAAGLGEAKTWAQRWHAFGLVVEHWWEHTGKLLDDLHGRRISGEIPDDFYTLVHNTRYAVCENFCRLIDWMAHGKTVGRPVASGLGVNGHQYRSQPKRCPPDTWGGMFRNMIVVGGEGRTLSPLWTESGLRDVVPGGSDTGEDIAPYLKAATPPQQTRVAVGDISYSGWVTFFPPSEASLGNFHPESLTAAGQYIGPNGTGLSGDVTVNTGSLVTVWCSNVTDITHARGSKTQRVAGSGASWLMPLPSSYDTVAYANYYTAITTGPSNSATTGAVWYRGLGGTGVPPTFPVRFSFRVQGTVLLGHQASTWLRVLAQLPSEVSPAAQAAKVEILEAAKRKIIEDGPTWGDSIASFFQGAMRLGKSVAPAIPALRQMAGLFVGGSGGYSPLLADLD